jgi:hypothetical protein
MFTLYHILSQEKNKHCFMLFLVLFCFCCTRYWTQGFMHRSQLLNLWSMSSAPKYFWWVIYTHSHITSNYFYVKIKIYTKSAIGDVETCARQHSSWDNIKYPLFWNIFICTWAKVKVHFKIFFNLSNMNIYRCI